MVGARAHIVLDGWARGPDEIIDRFAAAEARRDDRARMVRPIPLREARRSPELTVAEYFSSG